MFHVEHRSFRLLLATVLLAIAMLQAGCAPARSLRLAAPSASGLVEVGPRIFADPGLTGAQRAELLEAAEKGRERVRKFYGGLRSRPRILACATMDGYRQFGGIGSRGTSHWWAILLSPRGRRESVVAHEWSHSELAQRIGAIRMLVAVPQWFNEGVAVLASEEPEYFSEERWRAASDNGAKTILLDQLWTRSAWRKAARSNHILAYGSAGREVGRWYAAVGRQGLERLIEALRKGEPFPDAYERLEAEARR